VIDSIVILHLELELEREKNLKLEQLIYANDESEGLVETFEESIKAKSQQLNKLSTDLENLKIENIQIKNILEESKRETENYRNEAQNWKAKYSDISSKRKFDENSKRNEEEWKRKYKDLQRQWESFNSQLNDEEQGNQSQDLQFLQKS
jgi:hypothetical protein